MLSLSHSDSPHLSNAGYDPAHPPLVVSLLPEPPHQLYLPAPTLRAADLLNFERVLLRRRAFYQHECVEAFVWFLRIRNGDIAMFWDRGLPDVF